MKKMLLIMLFLTSLFALEDVVKSKESYLDVKMKDVCIDGYLWKYFYLVSKGGDVEILNVTQVFKKNRSLINNTEIETSIPVRCR